MIQKQYPYFAEIKLLLNEEILMIRYNPEANTRRLAKDLVLKHSLMRDISIKWFADLVKQKYLTKWPVFFVFSEADNDAIIDEMYLVRLYAVTKVCVVFETAYFKDIKISGDTKKINELGYDAKIDQLIYDCVNTYGLKLLKETKKTKIPEFAKQWFNEAARMINEIDKLNYNNLEWVQLTQELAIFLSECVENADQIEIEIEQKQIYDYNKFFLNFVFYDHYYYNLLLLRERLIANEEILTGQKFLPNKLMIESHEERLEYMRTIADKIKN